jgi:hypothetical protein
MQKDNRASNARYLGQVNGGYPDTYSSVNDPITEDQYQPMPPLFVEDPEQEPDPEELPDQDLAAQKTEYEL